MTVQTIPAGRRDWAAPWPGYAPVDITPPALRPAGLATPAPWVTDTHDDPAQVADWPERIAAAVVPYRLDTAGRPLNPSGRTGRVGRNLGRWGENSAADPIVIAGAGDDRRVLLIRRDDIHAWAIPGGMVDPGETAPAALVRELAEETGVDLSGRAPDTILARTYVQDWRASDHAWVASTVALYTLPETVTATAGDDAEDARWWPLSTVGALAAELAAHGGLYSAHVPLLAAAVDRLSA